MRDDKRTIKLDKYEEGAVIAALNDLRNKRIMENKSTDIIDEVLLKIIDIPSRKARVRDESR